MAAEKKKREMCDAIQDVVLIVSLYGWLSAQAFTFHNKKV